MATYIESRVFCPDCGVPVLARARAINHVLHLLLSIFLCGGWWLPMWAILCITHDPVWLCQRCGYSCDGPPNPARVFGWILLGIVGAVLLAVVGFFVMAVVVGSAGSTLATTPTPTIADESTPVAVAPREQRPDRIKPAKPDAGNREPEDAEPESRPVPQPEKSATSDVGFAGAKTVQGAPLPTEKTAPPPLATLTPRRNWPIIIGTSKYAAGAAAKSAEEQERWVKRGDAKLLTEPTEVEVIDRDRDFCKVRIDGKEWFVAAIWLKEVK